MKTFRKKIIKIGKHKEVEITREILEAVVANFYEPVPVGIEFCKLDDSPLKDKLGNLISVDVEGEYLYGTFEIQEWVVDVISAVHGEFDESKFVVALHLEDEKSYIPMATVTETPYDFEEGESLC